MTKEVFKKDVLKLELGKEAMVTFPDGKPFWSKPDGSRFGWNVITADGKEWVIFPTKKFNDDIKWFLTKHGINKAVIGYESVEIQGSANGAYHTYYIRKIKN